MNHKVNEIQQDGTFVRLMTIQELQINHKIQFLLKTMCC
jgi:hypothetical protein